MADNINWSEAIQPLLKKYKGKKHPLDYKNLYQFLVLVVLSAQSNDKLINTISEKLFEAFPNMESLARTDEESLNQYISKVIGFRKKSAWLIKIAKQLKHDKNIPLTMEGLTALPGIGRKSANVIMREAKVKAEGVAVDLHVLRVAARLGITKSDDPKVVEQDLMKKINQKDWGEAGMAISFLGRETCRPTDPHHAECVMNGVCRYYARIKGKSKKPPKK
jgi:endonuclease-3